MIGMDIVGPMKTTSRNNKYILTVIDYYTKFGEAVPLQDNQKSETICRVLEEIFSRHGTPTILSTDQGSNMESHVVAAVCKMFGLEKKHNECLSPTMRWFSGEVQRNIENFAPYAFEQRQKQ